MGLVPLEEEEDISGMALNREIAMWGHSEQVAIYKPSEKSN